MKNNTIFLFANPEFDTRFQGGISRLYQIFCKQSGLNMKIINTDFLKDYIPEEDYSQLLVIAGGDGTVHRVINTIPEKCFRKYIFGIIPGGTANEFARSLRIPQSIHSSANLIMNPKKTTYQHIGVVNSTCRFVTGILFGVASHVLQVTPTIAKHFLGGFAYYFSALNFVMGLFIAGKMKVHKFKIDSREFRTNYLLINNASLISKGLSRHDLSLENKKLFSLIYLHSRLSFMDVLRVMLKHQIHYHILNDPALQYEQVSDLILGFEGELEFLLDGDLYKFKSPLNIDFLKEPMVVISG